MFTKNFNSLPDSLIEATKKIMTESEKMSEASNEAPTINHLELSEEELNEIYVINSDVHGRIGRAGDKLRQAIGTTHNDSTHHRAIGAIDDLSHHLSIAHPEHRAILNQLKIAKQSLQRAANTSNNEEKAKHIETARQIHQKAQNLLRIHQNNNMQRLSQQGVNINSEFVPEEVNEALSPEAKKRRDKLKAEVRAAKDAYKQISKQAKSPKSGLAPLKTSVTPKEHESEDPEESARKHPIDRLRRIALSMKGGHFEYDNGERHPVSRDVARAIVKHYEVPSEKGGLKPYQKEKLQSDITKSHDHLMKHYNSISGTNEAKKLDEVPVETIKQIRTFNVEETDDETPPFEPDKKKVNYKGSAKSRATWLAKHARDTMKKQMKTEQVKPGGDMAPKIQVPEEKIVNLGTVHNPEKYPNAIPDPTGNLQRAIRKLANPKRSGNERSDSPTSIQTRIGEEPIDEREMTNAEMKKREEIVMKLKKKMAGFEKNYDKRAKDVMYATATKMAMKGKDNK